MLLSASSSKEYFEDSELALKVAHILIDDLKGIDLMKANLRTLKLGYDLAKSHPEFWQDLFIHLLPKEEGSMEQVEQILHSDLPVKKQEAKFLASTGKSRRTFYNYKKKLGFSRAYQS